jgi:hypothetical protein
MKEKITETKTVSEEKVTAITCNCCGKTETGEHIDYDSTITSVDISFGYGSRFDTDTWKMDLCDDCLEKWVSTFKHPIEKREII